MLFNSQKSSSSRCDLPYCSSDFSFQEFVSALMMHVSVFNCSVTPRSVVAGPSLYVISFFCNLFLGSHVPLKPVHGKLGQLRQFYLPLARLAKRPPPANSIFLNFQIFISIILWVRLWQSRFGQEALPSLFDISGFVNFQLS